MTQIVTVACATAEARCVWGSADISADARIIIGISVNAVDSDW